MTMYRRTTVAEPTLHCDLVTVMSKLSALRLANVTFERGGVMILDDVSLDVHPAQRWLVLGANGSGKTTLLRLAALYEHPTTGTIDVLGERLGRVDVRQLRQRIGYTSSALAQQLRSTLSALDVVRTAKYAALEPWWHRYDVDDDQQARRCLARMGVEHLADRQLSTLSSGEQQRVFLARTLINDPAVLLLDEPSARLDLGGREQLVAALDDLAADASAPPMVLVTHYVDEIPPHLTHAVLLRSGRVLAAGAIDETLTSESLSACFDLELELERRGDGRWAAWSVS
jgi:iron complex transport system ATP-binding protein